MLWEQIGSAKNQNKMLRTVLGKQDGRSPVPFWADAAGRVGDVADTKKLEELLMMIARDNEALWEIYYAKAKIQASVPTIGQAKKRLQFWVYVLLWAVLMMCLIAILDAIF